MSSSVFMRASLRPLPSVVRRVGISTPRPQLWSSSTHSVRPATSAFSTSTSLKSTAKGSPHDPLHSEETFEEFNSRYEKEFDSVQDVFELQRNLNNSFAYDLVPSTTVITAALRAARRVNDYPTAVRVFEGIKAKVENAHQYEMYLEELEPLRKELGIELKEVMYPNLPKFT